MPLFGAAAVLNRITVFGTKTANSRNKVYPGIMKFTAAFTFILCTSTIHVPVYATAAPPAAEPGLHVTMTQAGVAQVSLAIADSTRP